MHHKKNDAQSNAGETINRSPNLMNWPRLRSAFCHLFQVDGTWQFLQLSRTSKP